MDKPKHYIVLACAVLTRECYYCAAISHNIVDVKILEQGLHDIGEAKMSQALQQEISAIDASRYDAILLAYGLCNNGIRNLSATIPLVVPRAHDCIALIMGSKDEYMRYFNANSSTFYRSVGWIERVTSNLSNPQSTTRQMGMAQYDEYVELYGEENAEFLMEMLNDQLKNYTSMTYIDNGIPNMEHYQQISRDDTDLERWEYHEVKGSMRLIQQLVDGEWNNDDFLVVNPGETIEPSFDDGVIKTISKI